LGKQAAELVNEYKAAGTYRLEFNAGQTLSSGFYIYTLNVNGLSFSKKMLLVK
jgi:hypothetical protein